jgi:hypothetical protein
VAARTLRDDRHTPTGATRPPCQKLKVQHEGTPRPRNLDAPLNSALRSNLYGLPPSNSPRRLPSSEGHPATEVQSWPTAKIASAIPVEWGPAVVFAFAVAVVFAFAVAFAVVFVLAVILSEASRASARLAQSKDLRLLLRLYLLLFLQLQLLLQLLLFFVLAVILSGV